LGRRSHTLALETARRRRGAPTAGELRHALQARRRIPKADLVCPCPRDRPCGYCNGWGLYMLPSTWPHSANRRVASVGGCPRNVRCSWLEAEGTSQRLLCPPHRLRQLIRGVRIGGRAHAKRSGARPTHSATAATCTARPLSTDRASPPSLDATAVARGLALVDSGPFHVQQHPMVCVCTAREPGLKAGVAVSAEVRPTTRRPIFRLHESQQKRTLSQVWPPHLTSQGAAPPAAVSGLARHRAARRVTLSHALGVLG